MKMGNEQSPMFSTSDMAAGKAPRNRGADRRNESSGLLDIRRMAEVYSRSKKGRTGNESAIPEPVTAGFGTPPGLVLPLPAPPDPDEIAHEQASRNRLMWALCGVAGMLGLGAMTLAVVLVMGFDRRDSYAAVPQAATTRGTTQARPPASNNDGEQAGSAALAGMDREEDADEAGGVGASTTEADSDDDSDADRETRSAGDREPKTRSRGERRSRKREHNADNEDEQTAPRTQGCLDEIGCALAPSPPACCARYESRDQARGQGSSRLLQAEDADQETRNDIPRRLARADIAAGMRKVRSSVAGCRAGTLATGTVMVSVEVGANGRVENVRVKSAPADALGACVARKVRRARFPRSQQGATFSYPFLFK